MEEVIAVLQARMHSERLPGKILADLAGRPLILHVIERLKATPGLDRVVLAVPRSEAHILLPLARDAGVELSTGSAANVLSRFYTAARLFSAPYMVRVTGDNPLIDTYMLGRCIEECRTGCWDMVGTRNLPLGASAEVFPTSLLDLLIRYGIEDYHREHVTSYLYEHEKDFRVRRISAPRRLQAPNLRLTVDTAEDLALMRMIFDELYEPGTILDLAEVIRFLKANPDLAGLNSHVRQRSWKPAQVSAVA